MSAQGQDIRLDSLGHQDLMGLKERLGGDLERFANSANVLLRTSQTIEQAGSSISSLVKSKEGQQVLLPLTQSLYINGRIASVESVIVDVGTGYYVEMSCADGESYCKRKVSKLHDSLAGIQNVINEKQNQLVNVNQVISDKMQQQAAQAV